jgi:hypothetical protein
VIRVRYKDLSPGLHGKAEYCARGVTIYLLPGLTGKQRKAALRRLRQEASRGCGPALPLLWLTVALGADGVRMGLKNTAAVVRLHPAGSLLPAAVAGALMTLFVLTSVPVRIAHVPPAPSVVPAGGAPVAVPAAASPAAARPGAGATPGRSGRRPNTSWPLIASRGSGTGGAGLGWGARAGAGAGSGSTSGSGSGSRAG